MAQRVFLNGSFVEREAARLDIYDHGFLYGDGVFEGIRVYDGRIFRLDQHVVRLYRSLKALAIDVGMPIEQMREAILETCRQNNHRTGYIRVSISRGVCLGLDPSHVPPGATVVISTAQLSLYPRAMYDAGLKVITASTRVPPSVCIDPQVKSLGKYINSINAKMEANRVGAGEALMLNVAGNVAEASGDNLFLVRDGHLITPPTTEGALPGITRGAVIDCAAQLGIPVHEAVVTLYDCYNADEAFLTGTAAEVIPMVHLDGRDIASGKPGPVTARITDAFHALTKTDGALL